MKKMIMILSLYILFVNNLYAESENPLVNIAWNMAWWWIDIALKIWWWISLIVIIIWIIIYKIKNK